MTIPMLRDCESEAKYTSCPRQGHVPQVELSSCGWLDIDREQLGCVKLGHKTPPPILRNCQDVRVSSHGKDYRHHELSHHPHPKLDSMLTGARTSGGSRSERREVISRMRQGSNSFTESHDRPCIAAKSLKSILLCNLDSNALQSFKVEYDLNPASSSYNLIFRFGGSLLRLSCWWLGEKSVSRDFMTVATPSLSNKRGNITIKQLFLLHVFLIGILPYVLSWGDVSQDLPRWRVKMLIVLQSPDSIIIILSQIDT